MEENNLNNSIYTIWLLVLLIMLQHAAVLLPPSLLMINISISLAAGITFLLFLVQFHRNLKHYLKIGDLGSQLIILGITYTFMILTTQTLKIISSLDPDHTLHSVPKLALLFLLILFLATTITVIIQYIRLGNNLRNRSNLKELDRLVISLYLVPLMFILVIVFEIIKPLKPFVHTTIIIELLPYWFTYKLYKRLSEPDSNYSLSSNGSELPTEHTDDKKERK